MNVFSEDPRFAGLKQKTGLFLLLAGTLIAVVVVSALIRQDVFTQTMRLYFFADSAQGINKGMAVQLSGFKIGKVEEIRLEPDTTVKVRIVINSEYARHITQDSIARVAKEGLVGASIIEIEPGPKQSRPVPNNGVLVFAREADFGDMAKELKNTLQPILADIKQITGTINQPEGDVRQTTKSVREAAAQLSELARQMNQLAQKDGPKVSALIDKTGSAVDNLNKTLISVDRSLPDLLLKFDRTLSNAEAATANAQRLSASLSEDLPSAIKDGRAVAEDTREILDGAKRAWPLRNLIAPAQEKPLPLDSFDGQTKPAK